MTAMNYGISVDIVPKTPKIDQENCEMWLCRMEWKVAIKHCTGFPR